MRITRTTTERLWAQQQQDQRDRAARRAAFFAETPDALSAEQDAQEAAARVGLLPRDYDRPTREAY